MKNYRFRDIEDAIVEQGLLSPVDILLVGATGTGKSSTLNALFQKTVAKVGEGVDPETQVISSSDLHEHLRFHDSAGLGEGLGDQDHAKNITKKLLDQCQAEGVKYGFIDLVLVILDGGSRDLGTAYNLLESVVLKNISSDRVVVVVNQADMAMKGRHWCHKRKQPEAKLAEFLDLQSKSITSRIKEATGCSIKNPIYYSATSDYNIDGLMDHLIDHFPVNRRSM